MNGPVLVGIERCRIGGEVLDYRLFRSGRRTLGISVEPGGGVVVTAPQGAPVERIESVLRRRSGWIRRHVVEALNRPCRQPPREWVSGETHRYLGRQYRLKVRTGRAPRVSLEGGFFLVTVPEATPAAVRTAMQGWYGEHARAVFQRRMIGLIRTIPRLRLQTAPVIQVRRLVKRWGSCSPNGRLLINAEAVKLPIGCIDYLLVHELCHLRVPHHGPRFWRFLEVCMPDWDVWRQRLARSEL